MDGNHGACSRAAGEGTGGARFPGSSCSGGSRSLEGEAGRAPLPGPQEGSGRRRLLGRHLLRTVLTAPRFDRAPSIYTFLILSSSSVLMMYEVWFG